MIVAAVAIPPCSKIPPTLFISDEDHEGSVASDKVADSYPIGDNPQALDLLRVLIELVADLHVGGVARKDSNTIPATFLSLRVTQIAITEARDPREFAVTITRCATMEYDGASSFSIISRKNPMRDSQLFFRSILFGCTLFLATPFLMAQASQPKVLLIGIDRGYLNRDRLINRLANGRLTGCEHAPSALTIRGRSVLARSKLVC